jgi:hypothetical protein
LTIVVPEVEVSSASPSSPLLVPVTTHPENTIIAPNMKTYRFLLQFMIEADESGFIKLMVNKRGALLFKMNKWVP